MGELGGVLTSALWRLNWSVWTLFTVTGAVE